MIYGGGLVRGGASKYPGDFLARQGLVLVSFNYRWRHGELWRSRQQVVA